MGNKEILGIVISEIQSLIIIIKDQLSDENSFGD